MAKVLLVEDDKSLCASIVEWLKDKQYNVETADNGQNALELLETFEYDVVVLDWDLPLLSGVEVMKRFRAGGGNTPVLMLTGKSSINDKEEGLDSGADDYLTDLSIDLCQRLSHDGILPSNSIAK